MDILKKFSHSVFTLHFQWVKALPIP